MKKKVTMMYAMIFALTIGVVSVSAVSKGGGTWNYGVGITGSYSDYLHPDKIHNATVISGGGGQKDTDRDFGGKWAKARVSVWNGCNFYWGVE